MWLALILAAVWCLGAICYATARWKKERHDALAGALMWPIMVVVNATHQEKEDEGEN